MVERTTIEDKVDSRYVLGTPTNGTDLNLSDLVHGPRPSSQQPAHIPLPLRSATPHASTDGKPLQLRTKMIFDGFSYVINGSENITFFLPSEGNHIGYLEWLAVLLRGANIFTGLGHMALLYFHCVRVVFCNVLLGEKVVCLHMDMSVSHRMHEALTYPKNDYT